MKSQLLLFICYKIGLLLPPLLKITQFKNQILAGFPVFSYLYELPNSSWVSRMLDTLCASNRYTATNRKLLYCRKCQIGTSNLQLHERPHSKLSTFVTTSQREGDSPIYVPTSNLHPHAYELLRTVVSITSLSRHHSLLHRWRWLRSHTVSARRTVSVAVFSSRVLVRVLVLDRLRAGATLCETQLKVVRHRSKQHSESIGCLAEDIL